MWFWPNLWPRIWLHDTRSMDVQTLKRFLPLACADPESFVRGGQLFSQLWHYFKSIRGREEPNSHHRLASPLSSPDPRMTDVPSLELSHQTWIHNKAYCLVRISLGNKIMWFVDKWYFLGNKWPYTLSASCPKLQNDIKSYSESSHIDTQMRDCSCLCPLRLLVTPFWLHCQHVNSIPPDKECVHKN